MGDKDIPLVRPAKEDKIEVDFGKLWQDAYSSSVKIELRDKNDKVLEKGSGFLVGDKGDRVVTAFHVVDEGDSVKGIQNGSLVITTMDGKTYKVDVEEEDADKDVALLKLQSGKSVDQKYTALPISDDDTLKKGEDLLAISNPFGGGLIASLGEVDKYEDLSVKMARSGAVRKIPVAKTTFVVMPGSSGGLVVQKNATTNKTEIVGSVSALNQGEFAGSFAPITQVRQWMKEKVKPSK